MAARQIVQEAEQGRAERVGDLSDCPVDRPRATANEDAANSRWVIRLGRATALPIPSPNITLPPNSAAGICGSAIIWVSPAAWLANVTAATSRWSRLSITTPRASRPMALATLVHTSAAEVPTAPSNGNG